MALMSGKVYSNTGAPNNADGVNGDIYMQLDGFKTTYRKETASWVAIGSTLGAIPEFISGVGVPSNVLGEDGQYYRNSTNQDMYYKQGGLWVNVGNLTGAAFIPLLEKAGIGKDLVTAPNFVSGGSLDSIITSGEYYVSGVTELPVGVSAGFVKVWRIDANNVGQILQRTVGSSLSVLHIRLSSGGVFWPWQSLADSKGSASVDFQVLGGTNPNSAVAYSQLDSLLSSNGNTDGTGGVDRYFDIPVSVDKAFRVAVNTYGGAASNGTITFTNPFDALLGVWPSPIYNANISSGQAAVTQIKVATNNNFQFSSGVELDGTDSFELANLSFYWVAIGVINI